MNTPLSTHARTLLVIVAEAALEKPLIREARALGVQGWTVAEVHGRFFEGEREGAWEADRTIELKLLCERATAEALARQVLARYAPNYSVAMYFTPAEVLRPERF